MKSLLLLLVPLALFASACGGRTPLSISSCPADSPQCVQAADGCDAPQMVPPKCDPTTSTWSCPSGARVYARAAAQPGSCLPFHEPDGPIRQLGGSLARVPIDGGRCLWVAEDVLTKTGNSLRNVGFEQDPSEPFASCPRGASFLGGAPSSAVTIAGGDDPSLLVQIDGGYRIGGQTHVLYRLFQEDSSASFGVNELGSGLGVWDASTQQIVVPGPASLLFGTNPDLGDASLVVDDVPYVWGCHGPAHFLTNSCDLGRIDGKGTAQLFAGPGDWVAVDDASKAKVVFDSGPWISSIAPSPSGGFVHVYAVGFGSTLETHDAQDVTGPWAAGPTLTACDLPASDTLAFCAGPVVHEELTDPTVTGEEIVSYGVGTTASNQDALLAAHPEQYWTRLVWVSIP